MGTIKKGFLNKKEDFERVKRMGRRHSTPLFNLVSIETSRPETRIGIVVSRRLGKAVVRNRAKRIFRELVRKNNKQFVQGHDVVIFPKRETFFVKQNCLWNGWVSALTHEGLMYSV